MDGGSFSSFSILLFLAAIVAAYYHSAEAAMSKGSFEDNFSIMWSENHFTTSTDGQIWYLSLDNDTGIKSNA
jgi:xyloglucan:xyloglucosyl transferase